MANTWLNYHHLYYFRTIAKEGSIAKASKVLRLGQPALSSQLRKLESHLGVSLFERKNQRLILTDTGKTVLDYASEIFRMGGEMLEVLQDNRLPSRRIDFKFGALDGVPKPISVALATAAMASNDCTLTLLEGTGKDLFRELINHRIDLVLSNFPPGSGEKTDLYSKRIARFPVVICGAPSYRPLMKDFPRSLNGQPFILPTFHSHLRHELERYTRANQIHVDWAAEIQDISIQLMMSVNSKGLIPVPEPAVKDLIAEGKLIRIGELPGVFEEIYLTAASRKIENPISSRLMKTFRLS